MFVFFFFFFFFYVYIVLFFFFFFSSRRRHTRCGRDWSSDVCSSDLAALDDPDLDTQLASTARRMGGSRFAVRSSGAAEDLPNASYAGLYETYLNVPSTGLGDAVRRCFAAAVSERVTAYHDRHGGGAAAMAVLVQAMVDPRCAGVAFT